MKVGGADAIFNLILYSVGKIVFPFIVSFSEFQGGVYI